MCGHQDYDLLCCLTTKEGNIWIDIREDFDNLINLFSPKCLLGSQTKLLMAFSIV